MTVNSKVDICNMALGHLGNYGTISNIDTPTNDKETTFALWYDICRQNFLKTVMPNFCLARKIVAQVVAAAPFGSELGYQYAYEYPSDCLKLLGVGELREKENNYSVEGNLIWTSEEYTTGLPIRYIKDVTDVTKFSPEFKMGLSLFLAQNVALDITQDVNKANSLLKMIPEKMAIISGLNAQENPPIRISRSRFHEARATGFVSEVDKR